MIQLLARLIGRRSAPSAPPAAGDAPGRYVLRGRAGPVAVGWNADGGAYTAVPLSGGADGGRHDTGSTATLADLAEQVGPIPDGIARAMRHDAAMFPHRVQLDMPAYVPIEPRGHDGALPSPDARDASEVGSQIGAGRIGVLPARPAADPGRVELVPEPDAGPSVEDDEHWVWMVRALRGDSPYPTPSALAFVRSMRAVRDHIHPALRQALDDGDATHSDIIERWRGPDGEQFGPRVVDNVEPTTTALVMYRTLPAEKRGELAIESILRACGINPWSSTGIDAADELALGDARDAQRSIVLDALAQIHDALQADVEDLDTAMGRLNRLVAAWAGESGGTPPVEPARPEVTAVRQPPRQSGGPDLLPPAAAPALDALRRANDPVASTAGVHAVLAGLDALRSSGASARAETVRMT